MGSRNEYIAQPCETCLFNPGEWQYIAGRLNLTQRELQIVQRVFQSKSEAAISTDLSISPHTVHTHLGRLYNKLQVSSRVELVIHVVEKYHQFCREPGNQLGPICDQITTGECPFHKSQESEVSNDLKKPLDCDSDRYEGPHSPKS